VKRVRVEVDVSDLPEAAYFIDKRCEVLEDVLKKEPKYAECVVKRQHIAKEVESDPFVIENIGESLIKLDTWEVDTLSDSELLSYIDVQMVTERYSYSGSALLFLMIVILLGPFAVVFSILEVVYPSSPMSSIISAIAFPSDIFILLSGIILYRKRKDTKSIKHHIDLVAARENLMFLSALRKLASLSNIDKWKRGEYMSRLEYIEGSLAVNNS
jgi:hypothetical protein